MIVRDLKLPPEEGEEALLGVCARRLHAPVRGFRILKKSLDARDKEKIRWVYTVECSDRPLPEEKEVLETLKGSSPTVYIAGAGPAGLFCALRLLDRGIRPVLLERGKRVEEREKDVETFFRTGVLDPFSNVQFGEGGAGTFSDGKLNTQTSSPYHKYVLRTFVRFGAPAEILYLNKPHIGSDNLKQIVKNMRLEILRRGGEVRFSAPLTDFTLKGGALSEIEAGGVRERADALVLAIGHSARDTFLKLLEKGLKIEQKPFAAGVRVEHLQEEIGRAQFGHAYRLLPPADYKLVSHAGERAVFTFCMCPGGVVIPAASEEGGVAVNGMSDYARNGKNANSAVVAQVIPADFGGDHPLAGVEFQRKMEEAAFCAAGGGYRAPVQTLGDFLGGRESFRFGSVLPSYARGTAFAPVDAYLPPVLAGSIRAAFSDFGRKLSGFDRPDALLTGVESRTSSPVRVLRGEDLLAPNAEGVYPCGEGCGYAGGIMSSAADGVRVAERIFQKYRASAPI